VAVGAIISSGTLLYLQDRQEKSAENSALAALAIELDHVVKVVPKTESAEKEVAFNPMPSDAYRQALPYIRSLHEDTLDQLMDAELAIAAYTASAEFFLIHGPNESREKRTRLMGEEAQKKAGDALEVLLKERPALLKGRSGPERGRGPRDTNRRP
jgi:hypothetical protein